MSLRTICPWVAVLGIVVSPAVFAQSKGATIPNAGKVADTTGGVLAGAVVTARNEATNITVSTVANEDGRYFIPSLRPGVYSVTAPSRVQEKCRYRRHAASQPGGKARHYAGRGRHGGADYCRGLLTLLETENASRGSVIDERKIGELPLNGRDYNQLATLSPGVLLPTPRLQYIGFKGVFNVNGNRAFQNAFLLDGVDNTSYSNSFRGGNTQVIQPSIDALQEFKIQSNAYGAEFGRSAGALVNAVIKSGSNRLHGSAFEFFRNRSLDANNFFSNKTGAAKPFRLRNQFGGTMGGPIVKNKTFIFGDYEGLRDRVGTVWLTSVPQPAWTQGRFSVPIFNPYNANDTGQDFRRPATPDCNDGSGNCWIIPQNLIDPIGQKVASVNPLPNTGAPGQVDNNYVNVPITRTRADQFDVRVDHNLSAKFNLFGRYSFSDTNGFRPAPRPGLSEASQNDTSGFALWRSQAVAAGGTWVVSPSMVSETRFGWSRGNFYQNAPNAGSGCPEQLIGIKGLPTDESVCGGLPVFDLPGGIGRRIGRTTSQPQFQTPRSYDFRSSLTMVRGPHSLKVGGEVLHVSPAYATSAR